MPAQPCRGLFQPVEAAEVPPPLHSRARLKSTSVMFDCTDQVLCLHSLMQTDLFSLWSQACVVLMRLRQRLAGARQRPMRCRAATATQWWRGGRAT